MVDRRADMLQALSQFQETQKALLARTQSDLALLQRLRQDVGQDELSSETIRDQLADLQVSLPEYQDHSILQKLDWTVFDRHDPAPLRNFAQKVREERPANGPQKSQQSGLSDLQLLVKQARSQMIDPVMNTLKELSVPVDPDPPPNPEQLKRAIERAKIRDLRTRKIITCGGLTIAGARSSNDGVFVRQDVDETPDVDVFVGARVTNSHSPEELAFDSSTSRSSVCRSSTPAPVKVEPKSQRLSTRLQKPTRTEVVAEAGTSGSGLRAATSRQKRKGTSKEDEDTPTAADEPPVKKSKYVKGPKSDTYKQAWSESEQNLLERLLEEIPAGEKNRWVRISEAMNGRRTARQVASRVQKYFLKLSQYGITPTTPVKKET